ncbi:NAD-dependent succinate-semialdehyde dehydrogenase [Phytohabitans kaempferiae]|uniref:NAD-dependent succinate-semialdehyde dehydrogenase n=1 Tax=Phytohabitans kaempferiae TaxID=1620943 RepID=A0ABV6MAJ7_9ACTN
MFIGGEWVEGAGRIAVTDPATGEPVAEVANGSVEDMLAAVGAAADAGRPWAATAPRRRAELLLRAYELMVERADALARLIVLENGKTLADARGEVGYAAEFLRWYAEEAVRLAGSLGTAPGGGHRILVDHAPIGVSLLVTPWNFPAAMATRKIGPALAAGCTVVLKPASDTPLTALAIAALLGEAGVPDGVVNVVPSSRSGKVVDAALHDPRVRKLSFTGSTEVGRVLLRAAADRIVSSSMELGGNAPFLVFADADLDAAVAGAMVAKMRNGGQACTAANRFYVHRAVAEEFVARFGAALAELRLGPGLDTGVTLGPLINQPARDKVAELVGATVGAGARLHTGGHAPDRPGYFYAPTVLADVPPDAPVLAEEIFGPVAPVVAFDTEEEAISLANDTEYGLVSYLYTGDLARGLRVSEALEAGMVGLNRGLVSEPAAPFGGMKQSGLGREGARAGIEAFLEPRYVAVSW